MRIHHLALVALALAACTSDSHKEIATVGEALPGLPLPPAARVVARSGAADALQITFETLWPPDSLTRYYRAILSHEPWELQSDVVDAEGATVLYATRKGPPIWVRIMESGVAGHSSLQIIGAVVAPNPASKPDSGG